ncbi:MAG: inositol monophosphatase [Chloroflexota bacterium]|nr:inositol monophosphatase [Chloroflexota bacterium]MDE2682620.1 inositol monophosphatase [Chloroflexota bacterium]
MTPSDTDLAAIESAAVEFAQGAGDLLAGYFGRVISVEYKDKAQQDPVTAADKETQAYLERRIAERFPYHGILGEEDDASADGDTPAPDYLWVLDPLDGTTNFMNGLPVYASSIGVLHRGMPVAGAVYIPWPASSLTGESGNGIVVHCRSGGGAFANGEPITVYQTDKLRGDRLVGLPGSFGASTRVGKGLKGQPLGQLRVTGSIAYELAMTAMGVLQFAVIGAPRMWDMLGGAIAVQEAGGTVMTRLAGRKQWHPMESLAPTWDDKPPTMAELRKWVAPLVAANPTLAPLIAHNLHQRRRPIRRMVRGVKKALVSGR